MITLKLAWVYFNSGAHICTAFTLNCKHLDFTCSREALPRSLRGIVEERCHYFTRWFPVFKSCEVNIWEFLFSRWFFCWVISLYSALSLSTQSSLYAVIWSLHIFHCCLPSGTKCFLSAFLPTGQPAGKGWCCQLQGRIYITRACIKETKWYRNQHCWITATAMQGMVRFLRGWILTVQIVCADPPYCIFWND